MTVSSRIGTLRKGTLVERENQLNLLHQEILMRREALLHTSEMTSSLRHSGTHSLTLSGITGPADAAIRNASLLKDMHNLNQQLSQELNSAPSPRFVTLQSNYWSMVRGLLPLWEQSLSGKQLPQQPQQQQQPKHKSLVKSVRVSTPRSTK